MEPRRKKNIYENGDLSFVSGLLNRGCKYTMFQYIGFHLLAGATIGTAFKAPTLLFVVGVVFFEFLVLLTIVQCTTALPWVFLNATVMEGGYLIGIMVRQFAEESGRLVAR